METDRIEAIPGTTPDLLDRLERLTERVRRNPDAVAAFAYTLSLESDDDVDTRESYWFRSGDQSGYWRLEHLRMQLYRMFGFISRYAGE